MRFFYKTAEILYKLKDLRIANISELAREANITYAQLHKYIKQFKDKGFIVEEDFGNKREKLYKLTEKGQIIADSVEKIKKQI
ncbi:MAG TPA: MarR family transcriptional regulator [Candidatus Desulfofervidus auxilii]|uniref:MarR family transcriptional regulator n=1 Tax=Desulfofervidus auxilii TaxID=1621989 RepID=A0A7C0U2V2_DESA2|nr:MarR family transcriptional regulator [Candidatus Desulfofervidus auxilii]